MADLLRRHTPLLSWLLLAACLALFVSAGRWQYGKGIDKQQRIEAFHAARQQPARTVPPWPEAGSDFHRVVVSGQIGQQRYLLDNQIRDGRPGIEVFAPLQVSDGRQLLLALGWLPYPDARRQLPVLPQTGRTAALTGAADVDGGADPDPTTTRHAGLLAPPPAHGLRMGRDWAEQPGPEKLMSYFDLEEIRQDSGLPLEPLVLWLDPDPASPWQRDWQPVYGMPPARHLAYAWQWWSLAVASLIVFIVLHYRRRKSQ